MTAVSQAILAQHRHAKAELASAEKKLAALSWKAKYPVRRALLNDVAMWKHIAVELEKRYRIGKEAV